MRCVQCTFFKFMKPQESFKTPRPGKIISSLCKDCARSKSELYEHLKERHDVVIAFENLKFKDLNEFLQWKSDMERESKSKFISNHGWLPTEKCKKNDVHMSSLGFLFTYRKGYVRNIKIQVKYDQ